MLKRPEAIKAGQDVENKEATYAASGKVTGLTPVQDRVEVSLKTAHRAAV